MSVIKGRADSSNFILIDLWFVRFHSARNRNLIHQPATTEKCWVNWKADNVDL